MPKKTDLRVIKTRKNIRDAYLRLLKEKDFEELTVNEILAEAMVNRSTFYAHYRDKYDLRDQVGDEFLEEFSAHAIASLRAATPEALTRESLRKHLTQMLAYLDERRDIAVCLMDPSANPAFASKLADKSRAFWYGARALSRLSVPKNYAYAALSATVSGVLTEWAASGFADDRDKVADALAALLAGLYRGCSA